MQVPMLDGFVPTTTAKSTAHLPILPQFAALSQSQRSTESHHGLANPYNLEFDHFTDVRNVFSKLLLLAAMARIARLNSATNNVYTGT
jgi:hypothetical protein